MDQSQELQRLRRQLQAGIGAVREIVSQFQHRGPNAAVSLAIFDAANWADDAEDAVEDSERHKRAA